MMGAPVLVLVLVQVLVPATVMGALVPVLVLVQVMRMGAPVHEPAMGLVHVQGEHVGDRTAQPERPADERPAVEVLRSEPASP